MTVFESSGEWCSDMEHDLGRLSGLERHVGAGVQRHVINDWIVASRYDVSEKHFETNLHEICAAVSLWMTVIGARQIGQSQVAVGRALPSD